MLTAIKHWWFMRRYPENIKRLQSAYKAAVKNHTKRPKLKQAMNEQLKKELNT